MVTGVDESKKGTKVEEKGQAKVTPSTETVVPEPASKVSPEDEQPIYTQSQHDALAHAIRSEEGRTRKEVESERDNLRSQIKTRESELEDNQAERESLQKQLEDMSSDDPKRFDVVKKTRELMEQERELKKNTRSLEERETNLSVREKEVSSFRLAGLLEQIADDYEDGDSTKLKAAIGGIENLTEEQVRTIANTFWKKKVEEPEVPGSKKAPKVYSGKSEGGSPYFTRAQISDRAFWEENKEAILKAQKEGRIRD